MKIWAVFEAIFLIITGLLIAALWGVLLVNAQNSMMFNAPLRFSFHLFSECILTVMCIITGFGLLKNSDVFKWVSFFYFWPAHQFKSERGTFLPAKKRRPGPGWRFRGNIIYFGHLSACEL